MSFSNMLEILKERNKGKIHNDSIEILKTEKV